MEHMHAEATTESATQATARANRRGWALIALGIFGVAAIVGMITGDTADAPSSGATGSTHTVTYIVEGTTDQASITYQNSQGDTSQQTDIDVPLTRKNDGARGIDVTMRDGDFFYIAAQNSNESGTVTCEVRVDGEQVRANTSHGGFTIATCSGTV